MRNTILFVFVVFTLNALYLISAQAQTVSLNYDFRNGAQGWQADFADYPPSTDKDGFYQLRAEIRNLPPEIGGGTGFYFQGANHSDDLFMFLKRRLTAADGIIPGQAYEINYAIVFASNAQSGCGGVGGSPGESVGLKAGASPSEPLALFDISRPNSNLRMSVDKSNQSQGGVHASVAGNIANGQPCSGSTTYVSIQRTHRHTVPVIASSNGDLWLLVGTDSGYEGFTSYYYQSISVTLVPVATPAPKLLTETTSGRVAALDSVKLTKEPFTVDAMVNLSPDQRTRFTLFARDVELKPGEDSSIITVQAEDSQQRIYLLPVEAIQKVPNFEWITQLTVRIPDELRGAGDVLLSVKLRGVSTNKAAVRIGP